LRQLTQTKVDACAGCNLSKETFRSLFDKKKGNIIKGHPLDALLKKLGWIDVERTPKHYAQRSSAKPTLVTEMVVEFPELQEGVTSASTLKADEDARVSHALEEHYWPVTLTGNLPATSCCYRWRIKWIRGR